MELPSKSQKERYVRDMFNEIARKYDLMNTLMSFGMDKSWRKYAMRRARIQSGMAVLDVCCGTAEFTMEIARAVGAGGHVTGLDFSEQMLQVGQQKVKASECNDRIKLIQGNAMSLPFEDNSFDAATVGWGLRNVPDINQALQEMRRVVRPGGWIVSLDMAKPTAPIFKQVYWLYFNWLVPTMGKVTAKRQSAYQYLHDSSREFDSQSQLADRFARNGLTNASYHNLFGGVVAVVEGQKPSN